MTTIPYIVFARELGTYHVAALVYDESWLQPIVDLMTFKQPVKIERAGRRIDPLEGRRYPYEETEEGDE